VCHAMTYQTIFRPFDVRDVQACHDGGQVKRGQYCGVRRLSGGCQRRFICFFDEEIDVLITVSVRRNR
jgi:hypothetical protein